METFDISPAKITRLVQRKQAGDVVFKDKRGGVKKFKYTYRDRVEVCNHINLFPREVSHYYYHRARTDDIEYLSCDLNRNRMYAAFRKKFPNTNISKRYYYCLFKVDFPHVKF